ncbi:MAG: hypothetical protein AAF657_22655 [Acidobacteriota bacterium]
MSRIQRIGLAALLLFVATAAQAEEPAVVEIAEPGVIATLPAEGTAEPNVEPEASAPAGDQTAADQAITVEWKLPGLDDSLILQSGGSCGACNCNEDDDCQAICGKPASCERRICPCATCTGSCQC